MAWQLTILVIVLVDECERLARRHRLRRCTRLESPPIGRPPLCRDAPEGNKNKAATITSTFGVRLYLFSRPRAAVYPYLTHGVASIFALDACSQYNPARQYFVQYFPSTRRPVVADQRNRPGSFERSLFCFKISKGEGLNRRVAKSG